MYVIFVTICALVVLLGFEIRHREIVEQLNELKEDTAKLYEEILRLRDELKTKKSVCEEYRPPA